MELVKDVEILKIFNISANAIQRWKNDIVKYPHRYETFRLAATLIKNEITTYDVLSMMEKIERLEKDISNYVNKEEQLRKIGK
ncbi:MAG: hypothetical protein GQ570_11945 [Helicobacteraceae bacterium]|nr:hypothetical protein [Helicobacteraceae bacterium]